MSKTFYAIIFSLMFYLAAYPYSYFSSASEGVGLHQYITTARGLGMGGTGLALPDKVSLNAYNIATWRYIENTKLNLLMRYTVTNIDFGWQSSTSKTGDFSGLQLAIPIKKHKWVAGLSLSPYTQIDFSINQKYTLASNQYEENTFLQGNIARSQLNLVWSPVPRLGLAASFNYFFGTIQDNYRLIFNNQQYYDSSHEVEYQVHGPGAGLSADLRVADSLNIGGFFDFKPNMRLNKVSRSPITLAKEQSEQDITLPILFGIGGSYHFAHRWNVAADVSYQKWSDGFQIHGLPTDSLQDWYQVSFGLERTHQKQRPKSIFNKLDFRTGFSFGDIGYKFNNQPVKEYAVHFGLGIPYFEGRDRFDFGIIAGIRGNRSENLVQEKFYRFILSISAGELWFQKLR